MLDYLMLTMFKISFHVAFPHVWYCDGRLDAKFKQLG